MAASGCDALTANERPGTAAVSHGSLVASLQGVSKRYRDVTALDALNLDIRRGELLSLLGPNGAGKTTAIAMLLGLQRPDAGTARLFGQPPRLIRPRRNIGVMMQEVSHAPELAVGELIRLTCSYYPNPFSLDETIAMSGVGSIVNRRYGRLSGGQKRLAQFALAICGRPKLIFLDEPTTHLDTDARETLWHAIRELVDQGTSVLLTTHYIEEAESLADRVVVLSAGRRVFAGSVPEMRALVVRKFVDCVTSLSAEEVGGWTEVDAVESNDAHMRVVTRDAESTARRLLMSDSSLRDLEVRRASLADALKLLTRTSVQD